MEQKFPFTTYDFWAYLSSGFVLLFGIDQAFNLKILLRDSWTIGVGVIAFSCAYAAGHLVASLSAWTFEKILIGKFLGNPKSILFGTSNIPNFIKFFFSSYFEPLPVSVRSAAIVRGKKLGLQGSSEALFWPAFANARSTPSVAGRLDNFLNMYGFCRNASCVAFIDSALWYFSYFQVGGPSIHLLWSRIALVAGLGLLTRYMKFYRLYCVEIFTSFAYVIPIEKK